MAGQAMMYLGPFRFSIGTAAYARLDRETSFRWAGQTRLGTSDALQFVGDDETVTLEGVIFTQTGPGSGQVEKMRTAGRLATPLPLISGQGRVFGFFVIERVSEAQTVFAKGGAPKRQEFVIGLRRYGGSLGSLIVSLF